MYKHPQIALNTAKVYKRTLLLPFLVFTYLKNKLNVLTF